MDNLSLPACAMYRQSGTVIVKNEDLDCNRRSLDNSRTDFVRTPGKCEKCELTRTTSKYSECVSAVIEKSRPYRSSAARSSKLFFYKIIIKLHWNFKKIKLNNKLQNSQKYGLLKLIKDNYFSTDIYLFETSVNLTRDSIKFVEH